MKTMTCRQLGGACDTAFSAATFEEISKLSKQHAMEMFQQNDKAHLEAMEQMKQLMTTSAQMQTWMEEKKKEFDNLPLD